MGHSVALSHYGDILAAGTLLSNDATRLIRGIFDL